MIKIKTILILGLMTLIWGGLPSINQATGATPKSTAEATTGDRSADFEACVRLALRQSPFLTQSALEVDLSRLDETDSRWAIIPTIKFSTRYFVDQPTRADINPRPYSLAFITDGYNPFEAYFSLQAHKVLTQIAILGHLKVISEGLHRLAQMFLELDTLKQVAASQQELVKLARDNLTYAQERLKNGEISSLEVRVATQELELAKAERERLAFSQTRIQGNLSSFLGLPPDQKLTYDLRQTRRQVLRSFDAAVVSLEQARSRSFELKIQALKKKLQAWNITLAKTKLLPTLVLGVQTPDPLSLVDDRGYYFSVGLTWPIWDGFSRYRNISRQKTKLRKYATELNLKEIDLSKKWQEAGEKLRSATVALKLAKAQEELAHLKKRQSEIRYKTGGEPLSVFLEGRQDYLKAQKTSLVKTLEYDQTVLNLRHLSGDLVYEYVDESSWER